MIIAIVIFIAFCFGFLWLAVLVGKDPDGKEDRPEYWESFRQQRWEEESKKNEQSN